MADNAGNLTSAASVIMQTLEPLSAEERERVLQAAAALYGVRLAGSAEVAPAVDPEVDTRENPRRQSTTGKRQSIVEFLNEKQPATNPQLLACFAYYREHIEGKGANFSRSDLEAYFATSKRAKPGNYSREWNKAVSEGWIHDAGAESYLTQGGEEQVKAGFGGKGKPRGNTRPKRARKPKPAKE